MNIRHPHSPVDTAPARPGEHRGETARAPLAGGPGLGLAGSGGRIGPVSPPGPPVPGPRISPEAELAEQLDELVRCLARMDAVMDLIEADLDRRELAFAAIVEPLLDSLPTPAPDAASPAGSAGGGRSPRREGARPSRARRTTGRRARRARRRGGR